MLIFFSQLLNRNFLLESKKYLRKRFSGMAKKVAGTGQPLAAGFGLALFDIPIREINYFNLIPRSNSYVMGTICSFARWCFPPTYFFNPACVVFVYKLCFYPSFGQIITDTITFSNAFHTKLFFNIFEWLRYG